MNQQTTRVVFPICVAILIAGGWLANAGDLDPPAGPVGPTFKTLSQVEPRIDVNNLPGDLESTVVIDQPGSYILTADLNAGGGRGGIRITSDNVTLDLNGFTVRGGTDTLDGIKVESEFLNSVEIRNGTVTDFGGNGILVSSDDDLAEVAIKDVRVLNSGGSGIVSNGPALDIERVDVLGSFLDGVDTTLVLDEINIKDSSFTLNGGDGLNVPEGNFREVVSNDNVGDGIATTRLSTFRNVTTNGNEGHGINGGHVQLSNTTANNNGGSGVSVSGIESSLLFNVNVFGNDGDGINAQTATIRESTANNNGNYGISAETATIRESTANGNGNDGVSVNGPSASYLFMVDTHNNDGMGADIMSPDSTVTNSSAGGNTIAGIRTGPGVSVTFSSFAQNGFGALVSGGGGYLQENKFARNGAGVHVQSSGVGSTITGSLFFINTTGIMLEPGTENVQVTKNTFDKNSTPVDDQGTGNKVAPFNCPPDGAWDNTTLAAGT
jgi:hypothetical protein